ncbi:proline iminopeptidase-family hydrolase [Fodinicola acaciae]|uniref:proline iminopeptidase-family hydrolase n=1 Tax=Fodinicola acaciae TaxID=2681555 RepID=UPI0016525F77|nr:proline iminopeptidase-family hydrolase [Fodinicola acaciae]
MSVAEGMLEWDSYATWYRVTGDLRSGKPPLVVLHGGPGCTHDYVLPLADVADSGRAVVHYDQIGNGKSTHLPEAGAGFWTIELFLRELDHLLSFLGIADGYHLLGQSWGGMLGAEHAVRRPAGLTSLIIANSPASMRLWLAAANGLREKLPDDVRKTLSEHEAAGTTDSAAYQAATRVFYDRHVCRVPWPDYVARTFAAIEDDPTVYHTMNGPTEFHVVGTLKDWSIVDRLDQINRPTLLISGRHDEATPAAVQPYADRIPDVRWTIFEDSSHMPHVEEREAYMELVRGFLAEHD